MRVYKYIHIIIVLQDSYSVFVFRYSVKILFLGKSCRPRPGSLIRTMHDSFEGGIFSFYWEFITGGVIGFGCGALRPFAHGKTLYFNGCGHREARTVEMDLKNARYIRLSQSHKNKMHSI